MCSLNHVKLTISQANTVMKTFSIQCLLLVLLFCWVAKGISSIECDLTGDGVTGSYCDNYHETCSNKAQCPDLMHCTKAEQLCVCDIGLSFSHSLSKCERLKELFTGFDIQGPSNVNLPLGRVDFKALVRDKWQGMNWVYSWTVLDGLDNAQFAGWDGSSFTLTELKAGFVQVALSVSNNVMEGHISHNLTIVEECDHSVKIVECDGKPVEEFVQLWLPRDKTLRLCGVSVKAVSNKWVRIDRSSLPVDISGSTSPTLELSNFQITNESKPYEFLLSVAFADGNSSNSTVKIVAKLRPTVPVINVRNATVQLPADSVILKADILNGSVDVFVNFTWTQTDGPRVEFDTRNLLSPSIVGPLNHSGLYVFGVRGVTIAGDVSEAVLFLDVEQNVELLPFVHVNNFSVIFPTTKYVIVEPNECHNVDTFTWEPADDVPAIMLLHSDFHTKNLFLSNLLTGVFLFTLLAYGEMGNASTTFQLEVKNREANAPFLLDVAIRRKRTESDKRPFSFRKQKALVQTTQRLLQLKFGVHLMTNVSDILYGSDGEMLTLRLAITHVPNNDEQRVYLTESKLASVFHNNQKFLEQFKIISVYPTAAKCFPETDGDCGKCSNAFLMSDFFDNVFYADDGQNAWFKFFAWFSIVFVFVILSKGFHFLWQFQEGEHKIIETLEPNFFANGIQFPLHKGRFSPTSSLHKRKDSNLVNTALLNANYWTSSDSDHFDNTSEYEEDDDISYSN